MVGSFFACYASAGPFTRSSANYDTDTLTQLAAVFATLLLALVAGVDRATAVGGDGWLHSAGRLEYHRLRQHPPYPV